MDGGKVQTQSIFNDLSRSFRNRMLDIDLRSGAYNRPQASGWFVDQDFIPRSSTSCSVVVQGVKPGEKAELTTMWTLLGYPPTGIAVPLWVKDAGKLLPGMVRFGKEHEAAPLSDWSLRLADRVFSYKQGMGRTYVISSGRLSQGHIYICNLTTGLADTDAGKLKLYHYADASSSPELILDFNGIIDESIKATGRFGDNMSLDLDENGNGYVYFINHTGAGVLRFTITNFQTVGEAKFISDIASADRKSVV